MNNMPYIVVVDKVDNSLLLVVVVVVPNKSNLVENVSPNIVTEAGPPNIRT